MFFFFGGGISIIFFILGPFLIFGGLRRPEDRLRLVYSGIGSIVVGLGNLLLIHSSTLGVIAIIIGIAIIFKAARIRG